MDVKPGQCRIRLGIRKRIDAFEMKCYCRMLSIIWQGRRNREYVLAQTANTSDEKTPKEIDRSCYGKEVCILWPTREGICIDRGFMQENSEGKHRGLAR